MPHRVAESVFWSYYQVIHRPQFKLRPNSTDKKVFYSVFAKNEFSLPFLTNPHYIIDAGAYTGLSSIYFSQKYPTAKIFAIEPEKNNFQTMLLNIQGFENIKAINAGIWSRGTRLKITDRHTGSWGFNVRETSSDELSDVQAVSVIELLQKYEIPRIDIFKIDIEGSELELFSKNFRPWLAQTNTVILELHDRIYPDCSRVVYSVFTPNSWREYRRGEKVIFQRI